MNKYCVQWGENASVAENNLREVRDALCSAITALYDEETPLIDPCGSFLLRTTTFTSPYEQAGRQRVVPMDIVAAMPLAACSLEDLESGEYLSKRRDFLAALKSVLLKKYPTAILVPFQNDSEKDVLVLKPNSGSRQGDAFVVHIHARPLSAPGRISSAKALKKAPVYGNLVLEDFLMHPHLEKLHRLCLSSPTIVKAIVVLRCWAAHRGIVGSKNPQGFSGFHIAAIVLSLVEEGIITTVMSEENIVRSVWVQLARGHFASTVPTLVLNGEQQNIFHRTSLAFYNMFVRAAAEEALQFPSAADVFINVGHSPLHLRAGVTLRVDNVHNEWFEARKSTKTHPFWAEDVESVAHSALGNRIRGVFANADFPTKSFEIFISVRDQAEARQRLTRGPAIEDTAAVKAFDAFWGADRTSTRQFADGAVHRCVVWEVPEAVSQSAVLDPVLVIRTILSAAVRRHISCNADVSALFENLTSVLKERVGADWIDPVVMVEGQLRRAAQAVAEIVKNVPQGTLPCRLAAFDFISAALRSTEPFGVRPHFSLLPRGTYVPGICTTESVEPIHAVLTIDDKHKIPDTVEAISKMKGAICAQLASVLKKEVTTQRTVFATPTSVDIIKDGFLFRVYVAHYREISLLRALQRTPEANLLERKLFWAAHHAKFVQSICDGHLDFQEAVRLSRRWIGAMLLSDFVLPECVELLVAHAYMQPSGSPSTSTEGFIRFLQVLANHPWNTPLVIPTTERSESVDIVTEARGHDGMWIAAPYAPAVSPFTLHTPRAMIVERLVTLSTAALIALDQGGSNATQTKTIFSHEMSVYDITLSVADPVRQHPDREVTLGTAHASVPLRDAQPYRLTELPAEQQQAYLARLIEFDPVGHLVRKLRGATRETSMLFYDSFGPSAVAAVLLSAKPSSTEIGSCAAVLLKEGMGGVVPGKAEYAGIPKKKRRLEKKQ